MRIIKGRYLFGFWEGQPYSFVTDKYKDFLSYKNTIDKQVVIAHIEKLNRWLASVQSYDMFTGEEFNSGFYEDGEFQFPVDFLRYYKTRDIGIPYEYEEYLKKIL